MTVAEYIRNNHDKASYTIKIGKKSYLCNVFDANSYFGTHEVEKVTYRYNNEQFPVLHIA